ncbi:hypothetical protein ACWC09_25795 [Streptomyces sp. NPDC001617]
MTIVAATATDTRGFRRGFSAFVIGASSAVSPPRRPTGARGQAARAFCGRLGRNIGDSLDKVPFHAEAGKTFIRGGAPRRDA